MNWNKLKGLFWLDYVHKVGRKSLLSLGRVLQKLPTFHHEIEESKHTGYNLQYNTKQLFLHQDDYERNK